MDAQNNEKIKSGNKIVLIIQFIVTVIGITVETISFVAAPKESFTIGFYVLSMIVYIMTVVYAAGGYKKPHGNLLKDCFIIYTGAIGGQIVFMTFIEKNTSIMVACSIGVIILAAYMCGRLDRIKENKLLIVFVIVLLLAKAVVSIIQPIINSELPDSSITTNPTWLLVLNSLSLLAPLVQWITLSMAYLFRYHRHKEAGLKSSKDCE